MRVLSLFDGMSCGQIALKEIGITPEVYYASEIDKFAIKQTQLNFPNTIQVGDVRDLNVEDLGHIDLILAGSPCTDMSFSGKRKGLSTVEGIEIKSLNEYLELKKQGFEFSGQSYLFWEFIRILNDVRKTNPDVLFLLENVKIGNKGTSNRIRKITLFRNCWIEDKLHKISRYIVDFCKSNNIGTIIIGLNKEWKNEINIGKRNNQHFVSIPHSKLIDKIVYKANLLGIEVITHEESYTSKIDHLAFEPLKKQESYLGRRKKRGLFQSSIGELINADINGAIGIARKVIGDSFIGKIIDSGFVFNPVRINIL